jgi:hypothetical protein
MTTMVSCCMVADRGVGSYLVASGVGVADRGLEVRTLLWIAGREVVWGLWE